MARDDFIPQFDFTPGGTKTPGSVLARIGEAREKAGGYVAGQNLAAQAHEDATARSTGAIRGTGLLTHYQPTHGWTTPGPGYVAGGGERQPRGANLVASSEFGEPTSYKGGAGAPNPITVMRGTNLSYVAPPAPGAQFASQEYKTPLEAKQAYNASERGRYLVEHPATISPMGGYTDPEKLATERYGEYQTPGSNLLAAKTAAEKDIIAAQSQKDPLKVAQGQAIAEAQKLAKAKQAGMEFDSWLKGSPYSTYDQGKQALSFKPKDEGMARDQLAARQVAITEGSMEAGRQHFEDRQKVRKWLEGQSWQEGFNPNAYIEAVASNPEAWKELMQRVNAWMNTPRPTQRNIPGEILAGLSPYPVGP